MLQELQPVGYNVVGQVRCGPVLVGGGDAVERGSVLIKNNKAPRLVTCDVTRDT